MAIWQNCLPNYIPPDSAGMTGFRQESQGEGKDLYATYNGTTTAQQQGLGLKDRHGARDAADVSQVLGTFFSFLVFWTILILLQCILLTTATTMATTTWTREMSAGGLRCRRRVLTPRCMFLFYFLG